ncbi:MAG: ABC transporter permease [Gemmatimonadaceae bacterium]|nr:ABC transporter permease [Gemmatimonadaceae bacterium]
MSASVARRSAALLALRWHAGTGTLVVLTAALTLAGSVPALLLLGGTAAAPSLTLALGSTRTLLADWGGSAVVWPQLQQLALAQLVGIVRGAVLLTLMVGAATLVALHLARTAARSGEVIVARSVGASRRLVLGALFLEAGALAGIALFAGMMLALLATAALRATWPGSIAAAGSAQAIATTLGVAALVLVSPLLMIRALATTRLVDDDRRPLTLIIPAIQLGAALVVVAGGVTLHRLDAQRGLATTTQAAADPATVLQDVRAADGDALSRAMRFATFLDAQHAAAPGLRVGLGSSGTHRGFGTTALVMTDCGECALGGMPARYRTDPASHHAVSGDSFAISGLQVLAGRALNDGDRWDAPLVAVVSATLARDMFQDGRAVGRRIQLRRLGDTWFTVVGVVSDADAQGLGSELAPRAAVYVSILQHPVQQVEVATGTAPVSPDALRALGTPLATASTIAERLAPESRAIRWFTVVLLGAGALTALIAIGGLVAMLRLWLDSQQRELGVRRAVGARRRDIHALVLSRAALVALGGSLFGAWMGQVAWDVLPRVVPGAPTFDTPAVMMSAVALSALTMCVAFLLSHRFTRTPVGTLLIDVG